MNAERRQAAADLQTNPNDLGCESACTGCQSLHPPSPFIISLLLSPKADTHFTVSQRVEGWVDLGALAGYIPRCFTCPQTHLSTNRVWRTAATLIEANALPLSQTTIHMLSVCQQASLLCLDRYMDEQWAGALVWRRLCFSKLKLLLIAVEGRGDNGADSSLAINPGPSLTIESNTQGFFFAESADDVKRSVPSIHCRYWGRRVEAWTGGYHP